MAAPGLKIGWPITKAWDTDPHHFLKQSLVGVPAPPVSLASTRWAAQNGKLFYWSRLNLTQFYGYSDYSYNFDPELGV